jgi:Growth inhibitor
VAEVQRWDIVLIDLDPTVGHEQAGTRRALIVSRDPFHRSGMATICPISTRAPRYPGEVAIPAGEAGQTLDAVILCHHLRTIDLRRLTSLDIGGRSRSLADPSIRAEVRRALAHQLGLDLTGALDGAA